MEWPLAIQIKKGGMHFKNIKSSSHCSVTDFLYNVHVYVGLAIVYDKKTDGKIKKVKNMNIEVFPWSGLWLYREVGVTVKIYKTIIGY